MPARLSPTAAVTQAYERLRAWNDPAMLIHTRDEAEALEIARGIEADPANKPLAGLTFVVKDNIDVAGMPTTSACPAFAYDSEHSAFVVMRLETAGAIVIGKANLDQFATGLVGVRSPYGVPRNSIRPDLIPGGSSSGSATSVGAGIVDFSLGTDTAGSGRIPAGMNGIVGLKPTLGLFSATGMLPACRTLDTISIFAKTVALAAEVAGIAAAYDEADAYSRKLPAPILGGTPPKFRVGVSPAWQRKFFGDTHAEAAYAADLEKLVTLGAELVEIDFEPLHAVARLLYEGPWVAERFAATKPLIEENPEALHPVTLKIIGGAKGLTAVSAFEAMYKLADLKRATAPIFDKVDVLAVATVPRMYTVAELEADPIVLNSNLGSYTNFVNLLDMSAISVPASTRADGLPSSLTLIGRAGADGYIAGIAQAIEGAANAAPVRAQPNRIEIAVVGAHLSGLPLNYELTSNGGIFVREGKTTADYKLHALPTTPPKPGMLRAEGGSEIAVEVWSLEPEGFGRFVAGVPAPLTIGTVTLADGTTVKGFLAEAAACAGTKDITGFGGWRAYLAG